MSGANAGVATISVAGILAATPFGMSLETIAIATSFTMLGVFGRLGYEISRAYDTHSSVPWGRIMALFAGSMVSVVCITVLYLSILALLGIQNESVLIFGLIFLGFSGTKGFIWLMNLGSQVISRITGLKLPQFSVAGEPESPEDSEALPPGPKP